MSGNVTHSLVANLRQVPDLRELDDASLLTVVGASANLMWPAGSTIVEPGAPAEALYIVMAGCVAIEDEAGQRLAELQPGDYFGEQPLLEATTHTRRAVSIEDCELLVLPRVSLEALLEADPDLRLPFGVTDERRTRDRTEDGTGGQPEGSG